MIFYINKGFDKINYFPKTTKKKAYKKLRKCLKKKLRKETVMYPKQR